MKGVLNYWYVATACKKDYADFMMGRNLKSKIGNKYKIMQIMQ